jgi:chromosomal replication initiator protein
MHELIEQTAALFDVERGALLRSCRQQHVVMARQALMYALRAATPLSYEAIGELLGRRHHSTVMWGVEAAERRAIADVDYALKLCALAQRRHA